MLVLLPVMLFIILFDVVNNSIAIPSYMPSFSLHNQFASSSFGVPSNWWSSKILYALSSPQTSCTSRTSKLHAFEGLYLSSHASTSHNSCNCFIFLFKSPMFTRKWGTIGINDVASHNNVSYEVFNLETSFIPHNSHNSSKPQKPKIARNKLKSQMFH
jgi:hypothetical protein